jgi:hypothetical protein
MLAAAFAALALSPSLTPPSAATVQTHGSGIANRIRSFINSTFSGNKRRMQLTAVRLLNQVWDRTYATILNSTIVSNTAAMQPAASGKRDDAHHREQHCGNNNVTNNVQLDGGTFTSFGYNLTNSGVGTPFTAPGDLINTNPLIGPLHDNGGSTWTHALLLRSPAIDHIPNGTNGCGTSITSDQRAQPRPVHSLAYAISARTKRRAFIT